MLFENRDYNELVRNLYFAYRYFRFNPAHKNTKHEVLRKMGEVTKAEYHCLANYLPRPGYPWVIFSYLVGI